MLHKNVLSADNQQGRLQHQIPPWYVSGFTDGEGSFHIALYKDVRMKTGWKIIPEFHISQRISSRSILDQLVEFFDCGYVKANHRNNPKDVTYVYVVRDRNDLVEKIIPFFERYPLRTEKRIDFQLFARIVRMMINTDHRTSAGVQKIVTLAYQMNGSGRYRKRPQPKL